MSRQLAGELRRRVHAAGGAVGAIRLAPRPLATLPAGSAGAASGSGLEGRLWRYSEGVKLTVATRLLKESLGLRLVEEDEEKRGLSYDWVLWTREDAHWSARPSPWPLALTLALSRLAPGPLSGSRLALIRLPPGPPQVRAARPCQLRGGRSARQGVRRLRRLERQGLAYRAHAGRRRWHALHP